MKLVIIIGNAAVGKMTVGQELMKQTGLRLFHNHMAIEPVIEIFGYYDKDIVKRLREVVFEEFAKSENYGMIFTYMWAFDMQSDWDYIHCVSTLFEEHGAEVYYVELVAPQEIRLQRNETENRLKHKASKRNLEFSRRTLLGADEKHRVESLDGEILFENYIKIDNSNLEPSEVAVMIKERFEL
ncbi:MAG: AAA family ATPase [Faecalimonas sp.]|nr:AAA family ATPase [Faecalimonas sp.]